MIRLPTHGLIQSSPVRRLILTLQMRFPSGLGPCQQRISQTQTSAYTRKYSLARSTPSFFWGDCTEPSRPPPPHTLWLEGCFSVGFLSSSGFGPSVVVLQKPLFEGNTALRKWVGPLNGPRQRSCSHTAAHQLLGLGEGHLLQTSHELRRRVDWRARLQGDVPRQQLLRKLQVALRCNGVGGAVGWGSGGFNEQCRQLNPPRSGRPHEGLGLGGAGGAEDSRPKAPVIRSGRARTVHNQ